MRVLSIEQQYQKYRADVHAELAKSVDLTVVVSHGPLVQDRGFRMVTVPELAIPSLGAVHKKWMRSMANQYDVVIVPLYRYYATSWLLGVHPRKYKLIQWGIGVSASYQKRYDEDKSQDGIRKYLVNRADAAIFYAEYPVGKFAAMGVDRAKLFVAPNTVVVSDTPPGRVKDSLLFVGTLYPEKRVDLLLEQYKMVAGHTQGLPKLVIIGDGSERGALEDWVRANGLAGRVEFTGAVYDEEVLKEYFASAIACVSPDQAGLSVQKAMGYGVPYITTKNAFTGGEIFDIHDGVDGVLMDSLEDLPAVLTDIAEHRDKYIEYGEKARSFYWNNRTIGHMVAGILDAIAYCFPEADKPFAAVGK